MRNFSWAALLCTSCATIPIPQDPPANDVKAGVELDACVLWGAREQRRRYEGVSELSFERWEQAFATVVLRHPSGVVLVDPAFGYDIEEDLRRVPPWFRVISGSAKGKTPAAAALLAAGIEPRDVKQTLLTHVHWDHAGGLRDLPTTSVRMSRLEYEYLEPKTHYLDHGVMPHLFEHVRPRIAPFELDGPPVLRFEASHDVFGDGSVIAVPLPGHTPGSTGYLVRGKGGKRWLLIGDATWTLRGVEKPAHKMVRLIDLDGEKTGESIGRLHAVMTEHPEIAIVPAHDAAAFETMPTCESVTR